MKQIAKIVIPNVIMEIYHDYNKKKQIKFYAGNKVKCPICNSEFKFFAPYNHRNNVRCLSCDTLDRHRLLWKYLNEKTNIFMDNVKLLHFAPEKVFYNFFSISENIKYYPCDLFPERYDYLSKRNIYEVDITNIPFDNDFFDIILCNHVLEHIPDDNKAMSELYRVMKIGAWGIFQVPIDYNREKTYEDPSITTPKGRDKAYGFSDHVRLYGCDYKDRLASIGFKVIEDDYVNNISDEDLVKYGLCSNELIYYVQK
jgi:SAM-dependent methyltransferase